MQKMSEFSQSTNASLNFSQNPNSVEKVKKSSNPDRVMEFYKHLRPLTFPYHDSQGNTIQLWKVKKYGLIGSVISLSDQLCIIPSHKIINPTSLSRKNNELLERIESIGLRRWSIVFNPIQLELTIWPYLIAAGNGDIGQLDTYQKKLNPITLSAAKREQNAEIVKFKKNGEAYDHRIKVDQNLSGLNTHIGLLKRKLENTRNPPSATEKEQLRNELGQSERFLKYVNRCRSSFHYKAYRAAVNTLLNSDQKAKAVWKKHIELFKGPVLLYSVGVLWS